MSYATTPELISEIFRNVKTIALVGASYDVNRPSHWIMDYLMKNGFTVYPVRPLGPGDAPQILGRPVFTSLDALERTLKQKREKFDLVNVFRRNEALPGLFEEILKTSATYVWCQDGVVDMRVATDAEEHGLKVVMDDCIYRQHRRRVRGASD